MAAKKLESLGLRGVSVVGDGMAVELRLGSYAANMRMPMVPLSMRHPSPGCREDQTEPPQQRIRHAISGADDAATRAGRPGSHAGVLGRRNPARIAGRAVQFGWPIAVGSTQPRLADRSSAHTDATFPGRYQTSFAVPTAAARALIGCWRQQIGKRQEVGQANTALASGAPAISTWGSGG